MAGRPLRWLSNGACGRMLAGFLGAAALAGHPVAYTRAPAGLGPHVAARPRPVGRRCKAAIQSEVPASGARGEDWEDWGDIELCETLEEATEDILGRLRRRRPQKLVGLENHEMPPLVPKKVWTQLGNLLKAQEGSATRLPEEPWVTLRLDGCAWGTLFGRLKAAGVLPQGFCDEVGDAMRSTLRAVMVKFGGILGYTHSDEFTVIVPPGPRLYEGLAHDWISIAASVASGEFNRKIAVLAAERGVPLDDTIVAHFDCRAGVFDNALQATCLVLWRAYDCHVNSASDCIKFSDAPMSVRRFNTLEKLHYLQGRGLLPMLRHQAYGSLLVRDVPAQARRSLDSDGDGHASEAASAPGAGGAQDGIRLMNDGAGATHRHVLNLARLGPLIPAYPAGARSSDETVKQDGPAVLRSRRMTRFWAAVMAGLSFLRSCGRLLKAGRPRV